MSRSGIPCGTVRVGGAGPTANPPTPHSGPAVGSKSPALWANGLNRGRLPRHDLAALQAGVRCLPFALTMGVMSPVSAKLAARVGTKVVVTAGLAAMVGGFGVLSTASAHSGYLMLMVATMMVASGMGLAMAPATESIMGSLPRAQAGVGSAVNDTTRFVGGALGVALTGSVASSAFASHLRPVFTHMPAR